MKTLINLQLRIDPQANLPVYAQIRQQLTWLIASDSLPTGTRLPTVREMAKQLGINLHTVRQAYHALEADGLVETKPGKGTHVLPMAVSQMASNAAIIPSQTVGVLLPNLTPFYAQFLLGLEEVARRLGYLLVTCFFHDNPQDIQVLTQQLVSRNVDGLIGAATREHLNPDHLPGLPVVCMDAPTIGCNSILLNLEAAGYEATRHLIWHGHKRIGLITAPLIWPNSREPAAGYRRALRQAGLQLDEKWVVEVPEYLREFGYEAARQLLNLSKPPTAIFASGDILALGALQAVREAGLRVPHDIAIASKDNIEFSELCEPPLTTVAFPVFEAGAESMTMLHDIIRNGGSRKRKRLPGARLIVRQSCGCEGSAT